jgi:methylenetetrahydrofolate reductase (NADPH)
MRLADVFAARSFVLSFEVFPPKTEAGRANLTATINRLAAYDPGFVSCTYGAGGSTRGLTLDIVSEIKECHGLVTTAHLTCVGSTVDDLVAVLEEAVARGIPNIMALRGDPPKDQTSFTPVPGGLRYANELVALIRSRFPQLGIGVAGYPETHQEAPSFEVDLANLVRKVDAGADAVFTQLFYDNDDFYRFRDHCVEAGISVPIVPGILPIISYAQIQRIAGMCRACIPVELAERLEECADDKAAQVAVGVEYATEQCACLMRQGVPGIHFYVLNQCEAAEQVWDNLNLVRMSR